MQDGRTGKQLVHTSRRGTQPVRKTGHRRLIWQKGAMSGSKERGKVKALWVNRRYVPQNSTAMCMKKFKGTRQARFNSFPCFKNNRLIQLFAHLVCLFTPQTLWRTAIYTSFWPMTARAFLSRLRAFCARPLCFPLIVVIFFVFTSFQWVTITFASAEDTFWYPYLHVV